MIIRALNITNKKTFNKGKVPGSYHIEAREGRGLFEFLYFCPCGCGLPGRLLIGDGFKPAGARPSWRWNSSTTEPTLEPSVHQINHWHGYLRDGYWEPCA